MQALVNSTENDSCGWYQLECGVVNILTIDDGYEEVFWKYPEKWGYKVCCFDLHPHNL